MKQLVAASILLIAVRALAGECVEVQGVKVQPSPQSFQIFVLESGRRVTGASVVVTTGEGPRFLSASTDANGSARLSDVPTGSCTVWTSALPQSSALPLTAGFC